MDQHVGRPPPAQLRQVTVERDLTVEPSPSWSWRPDKQSRRPATVHRHAAADEPRVDAHQVEARTGLPHRVPRRQRHVQPWLTGPARADHQRADPVRGVTGRKPRDRHADRAARRVGIVQRHHHVGAPCTSPIQLSARLVIRRDLTARPTRLLVVETGQSDAVSASHGWRRRHRPGDHADHGRGSYPPEHHGSLHLITAAIAGRRSPRPDPAGAGSGRATRWRRGRAPSRRRGRRPAPARAGTGRRSRRQRG